MTPSERERLPLSALLSPLLVAFIIECDNEFEHRVPHRTTKHGSTPGPGALPWLVSMAMWVNCMRFVPESGIAAGELARRMQLSADSARMVIQRMSQWWGYLVVDSGSPNAGTKVPPAARLVRPTEAGRKAQLVWEPLTTEVEQRWEARFGETEVAGLRTSLAEIVARLDVELPDFLPIGTPRLEPRRTVSGDGAAASVTLPALLSKVLLAFALDFEHASDLSLGIYTANGVSRLPIAANILRVLDTQDVRTSDVPALTGVAKMTIDNWLGALEQHRYAIAGAGVAGSRFKTARLTSKGRDAKDAHHRWTGDVERRWAERFGDAVLRALRSSTERLVVGPAAELRLKHGMKPYPDGWRARVPEPRALPHYPVVSHRGGYPDGN